jgi:hypothetical protein
MEAKGFLLLEWYFPLLKTVNPIAVESAYSNLSVGIRITLAYPSILFTFKNHSRLLIGNYPIFVHTKALN